MSVALSYPYCSLSDVQDEIRNHSADIEDKLRTAINLASRRVDEHCNRDFKFHDHATTALPVPTRCIIGDKIFLPWPILTLTVVTENEVALDANDYYFEAGEKWIERVSNLAVRLGQSPDTVVVTPLWMKPGGGTSLTIKGTFGYALETTDGSTKPPPLLPASLRRACALIASAWSGEYRKESVSPDGQKNSVLDATIPREALMLLRPYIASFL